MPRERDPCRFREREPTWDGMGIYGKLILIDGIGQALFGYFFNYVLQPLATANYTTHSNTNFPVAILQQKLYLSAFDMSANTRKYNDFQAIWLALYSGSFYRDVVKNWAGVGFLYIALLVSALLLPVSAKLAVQLNSIFKDYESTADASGILADITEQFPEVYIQGGELFSDVTQPYYINERDGGKPIIIIDTTGSIDSLEGNKAVILITKNFIFVGQEGKLSIREMADLFKLEHNQKFTINKDMVGSWINSAVKKFPLMPIFFFISSLISMVIFAFVRGVLFSIIATILASAMQIKIEFKGALRLALITSTPVIMLELLSIFLGYEIFQNKEMAYFAIHSCYLYFALEAIKKVDGLG